MLTAVRL